MKLGISRKIVIMLGIIVAIMPFLGFPSEWKDWMYIVLGTAVVTVTVLSAVPPHLLHRKESSTKEEIEEEYNRTLFDEEEEHSNDGTHKDDERQEKNDTER